MAKSRRVGKLTLVGPDGSKQYFGGVIGLAVFSEEGEGFDKITKVVTESGREIELVGFLNISAKL
jgi:hypothetical protein